KKPAEGDEAQAELVLDGSIDRKDPHASKRALFQVVVLPPAKGLKAATDAAVKHVRDREKVATDNVTAEPIKDKSGATGKDLTVNGLTVQRTRLELRAGEDAPYRYVDLAVANLAGGTVALVGECPWDKRDYWEQEFLALFNSLKPTPATGGPPAKPRPKAEA